MCGSCRTGYIRCDIRPGRLEGNPMARDSQAALVALNRFGFGARGGASNDLADAASDPRGFVKAELSRPARVLLEMRGLRSTPALAETAFAYLAGVKIAREIATKASTPVSEGNPEPGMKAPESGVAGPAASREEMTVSSEPIKPDAEKPTTQPLNVIQKTYRAEALARLQRAIIADC